MLPAMMSLGGFVVAMQGMLSVAYDLSSLEDLTIPLCAGVATNYAGFVACRVFLGLFVGLYHANCSRIYPA